MIMRNQNKTNRKSKKQMFNNFYGYKLHAFVYSLIIFPYACLLTVYLYNKFLYSLTLKIRRHLIRNLKHKYYTSILVLSFFCRICCRWFLSLIVCVINIFAL